MKKKNLKLSFKKETISKLQMNQANGGDIFTNICYTFITCPGTQSAFACPPPEDDEDGPVDNSTIPAACTENTCAP